jgi:2'-hydroxyisoflavone reductase
VTVFNRGRSAKGMFGKDVEELAGDRAAELTALQRAHVGRGHRRVGLALQLPPTGSSARPNALQAIHVGQYLFVSTRSVYADTSRVPMTNAAPVLTRENSPLKPRDSR